MATDEPMADAQEQLAEPVVSGADGAVETKKTADDEVAAPPPVVTPSPPEAETATAPDTESAPAPAQVQPEQQPRVVQESAQPEPDQLQQPPQQPPQSDTASESDEIVDAKEQMSGDVVAITASDVVVDVDVIELDDDSERPQDQDTQQTESVTTDIATTAVAMTDHHATNLLHEAVERQTKLREDSEKTQQEKLLEQLQRSPLAVVNPHPEAVQSEAPDEEDVKTKNIPDLYYLFTNDKLKEEPLTKVLNSDPFCIPRLTDNVPEYRPAFNPLSILEGEEKLLPRYFRLDPYEGIPGVGGKAAGKNSNGGGVAVSQREKNARDRSTMSSIPIRAKQVTGGASAFKGKTSTFMGTLPRQSEFSEIAVPDTIFQQTFRPTPPPPLAPHPSYASKSINSMRAAEWEGQQHQGHQGPTGSSGEPLTPSAALTDAIFLTSLHQSGSQHQHSNATTHSQHAYSRADHQLRDYYASKEVSHHQQQHYSSHHQQQYDPQEQQQQSMYHHHQQDLEHNQQQRQQPEKLTRYLPTRTHHSSSGMSDHTGSPTPYMDDASYLGGHQHQYQNANIGGGQYLGSMFDDYRDSESHFTDDAIGRASSSSMYGDDGSSSSQFLGGGGGDSVCSSGDNQSLQPIPKKPRSKNVFRPCTAPGCTKGARGKSGLCQKHGGGKRCAAPNCSKGAQGSSTMCLFHGGGYRCTVDGCSTGARGTSGLCAKHGGYKRGKEPGGGGASPASSSGGNGNGKRARTQHSPMDFDDHNDQTMDGLSSFSARESYVAASDGFEAGRQYLNTPL